MPCRSESEDDIYNEKQRKELDLVTKLLCGTLKFIETEGYTTTAIGIRGLTDWWNKHQEWDRKRIAEEEKREQDYQTRLRVWNTLSPEERRAIGLYSKPVR